MRDDAVSAGGEQLSPQMPPLRPALLQAKRKRVGTELQQPPSPGVVGIDGHSLVRTG